MAGYWPRSFFAHVYWHPLNLKNHQNYQLNAAGYPEQQNTCSPNLPITVQDLVTYLLMESAMINLVLVSASMCSVLQGVELDKLYQQNY